ncbi:diguanylate cyclase domain-containing protein [Kineococcus sp. TBRC 1896]|uniref:Diguanylate cyclase domain-containing protein n=1 Tax=Kineococcus mangrovi TaxID=1660183 RepID=A0ABV4I728_9ACTN
MNPPPAVARALAVLPVRSLVFTALFAVTVYLGRLTVLDGTSLSLVWPAAGVAAAWFCRTRHRWLDAALLAVVTVTLNALTGAGPVLLAGFVVTNLGQALLYARLRRRWSSSTVAHSTRHLAVLLGATAIACAAGALGGTLTVAAAGGGASWLGVAVWFTRNLTGIALLTPVVLRLETGVAVAWPRTRPGRLELVAAVTVSCVTYAGVFWGPPGIPLAFLPLAATIWLALRFDTTLVVVTSVAVATITVVGTFQGAGPFAGIHDDAARALVVQVHVGFVAALGMALAVGRDERAGLLARLSAATTQAQRARADAERSARFSDAVLTSVGAGIVVADPDGRLLLFNDTARAWHGLDADDSLDPTQHADNYHLYGPDGTTPLTAAQIPLLRTLAEGAVSGAEMVIDRPGVGSVPVVCTGRTVTDGTGTVLGAVVAMHDTTEVRSREAQLARANAQLGLHAARVERLAVASRAVLTAEDPRRAVCEAAVEIADAHAAFLAQPDDGRLVVTASTGMPEGFRLDLDVRRDTSLTLSSYLSRETLFVADVALHPQADTRLVAEGHLVSGAWQPVVDGDGLVLGVLCVAWRERVAGPDPTTAAVLAGLAAEAAHAFSRADLLARLAQAAEHDPLTGAVNRRRWDVLARQEIARATRSGTPLTFALLDLDHFKRYNDTRGHLAGDELLRAFTAAATAQLREADTLARWGGEEFALLLPDCTAADAVAVVDRIRAAVPDGQTCTVGVCEWAPGLDALTVVAAADRALYAGKGTRDATVVGTAGPVGVRA